MNWNNFQFCCRYLNQKLSEGVDLLVAQESLIKDYPRYHPKKLFTTFIYQSIFKSNNQKELLTVYGNMKLNWNSESIIKLANIKSYLFAIYSLFMVVSLISYTFVVPTFQEVFTEMGASINSQLEYFSFFWFISFVVISICVLLILRLSHLINQIKMFIKPFQPTLLSKILLSKELVNQIQLTDALMYMPLKQKINQHSQTENKLYTSLKNDNLDVSKELETLINSQYITLTKLINTRLTALLSVLAFFIVTAIFNFLHSLYVPIFAIGNMI